MSGVLHGVGLGPGDPELLTLRAHRLIRDAHVITYPAPLNGESFARKIADDFIPKNIEEIRIDVPMTSARGPAQEAYDRASATIATHLGQNRDVVALCEGDPFFYGSFMYLFARLAENHPVEITPGVTSMTACAARLQTPLSARNEPLSVIPGTLPDEEIGIRLRLGGAAAIIKVGRRLARLRALIADLGLLDRAGFVAHATLPYEQISPLKDAPVTAPYFSMILIRGQDPFIYG